MAVKLTEIRSKLEDLAPRAAAEDWDNPGLLLGRGEREIQTVYVALDASPEAVEEACRAGAELLLTHHPVIFRGIKAVNDLSAQGSKFLKILQQDLSVYSMHTNFDSCPGGMADIVCERLGLKKLGPMEKGDYQLENSYLREKHSAETGDTEDSAELYGIGFVAELPREYTAKEFSEVVKERFGLPFVTYYDAGRKIRRIACCPGSGRGEFSAVLKNQVDAFLTGDMGHHEGLDYMEEGISLIDGGHYGLEHIFVSYMADFLRKNFPELTVIEDPLRFPARVV